MRHVDLEGLVRWVYADQRADVAARSGVGLNTAERRAAGLDVSEVSRDGCYQVWRRATGHLAGSGAGITDVHLDAEFVHDQVMRIGGIRAGLIIEYAKTIGQPEYYPGARIERRPRLRKGKQVKIYDLHRNPIGIVEDEFVIDQYGDIIGRSGEFLELARRVYSEWQSAMMELLVLIGGPGVILGRHVVTGLAAGPAPWQIAA